jgi:hypothetical protein
MAKRRAIDYTPEGNTAQTVMIITLPSETD